MNVRKIGEAYKSWCTGPNALVLATVVKTEGSTYSKAGARMLIDSNGDFEGLLSGGCLENDLIEHARQVIKTGQCKIVSYDMRGTDDEFWGLGVGCNGAIDILLQRLTIEDAFEPLKTMVSRIDQNESIVSSLIVASTSDSAPVGASIVSGAGFHNSHGIDGALLHEILAQAEKILLAEPSRAFTATHKLNGDSISVLYSRIDPAPQVLVLGAGPDALPVVELMARLGWNVTLVDHRPTYVDRTNVASVTKILLQSPSALEDELRLDTFAAAVVMSHNLTADRQYLRQLAASSVPFVGLLGPVARKTRLLNELGELGTHLQQRVSGPVGFDIGANTPESIALSIAAQVHAAHASRCGLPLDNSHA